MLFVNTDNLKILQTYDEMINQCKVFAKAEFDRISPWSYSQIHDLMVNTLKTIENNGSTTDPLQIIKECYLIYIYSTLSDDQLTKFISILLNFIHCSNHQPKSNVFAAYVASTLLTQNTKSSIIQNTLINCSKTAKNNLATIYFLYYFVQNSPKAVLLNAKLFSKLLSDALFSLKFDIRQVAGLALKQYIAEVLKKPDNTTDKILKTLLQNVSLNDLTATPYDPVKIHGYILILMTVFENKIPSQIENSTDLINALNSLYYKSQTHELRMQCAYCLILLSPIIPEFEKKFLENLIPNFTGNELIRYAPAFVKWISLNPDYIKTNIDLVYTCLNAYLHPNPIPEGFQLLSYIFSRQSSVNPDLSIIKKILTGITFTEDYIRVIPPIMSTNTKLWNTFEQYFQAKILEVIKNKTPDVLSLKLLAVVPSIKSPELVSTLQNLLHHPNPEIRCNVPSAIIQHSQVFLPKDFHDILHKLLIFCLSECDSSVRQAIIESFPQCFVKHITSAQDIRCLALLANDECLKVRKAVIELLGQAAMYTPFRVYPILRRVLLDVLFLLDAPRSHQLRCEMTKLLLSVVKAGVEILPIYAPLIIQMSIDHLSSSPPHEMTVFEQKSFYSMNVNLIRVLDVIAHSHYSLLSSHISQFLDIFIKILGQHNPKKLKLATITTLTTFLEQQGDSSQYDRRKLFHELMEVSLKWSTRKLNVALLKLLGQIGAVYEPLPHIPNQTPNDHLRNNFNIPSDEIDIISRVCLQVLEDESLSSAHHEASRIMVVIFCNCCSVPHSYFKQFMPLFFKQIQSPQAPSTLFSMLKQICTSAPQSWVTEFSDDLVKLTNDLWGTSALPNILDIIPSVAFVLLDRFTPFLPQCITLLLDCLFSNRTENPLICKKVLIALIALRKVSADYLFLIVPQIISAADFEMTSTETRINSLVALRCFIQDCECTNFASSIVRCIVHLLNYNHDDGAIVQATMQVIYSLQISQFSTFQSYQETVYNILRENCDDVYVNTFLKISQEKSPLKYSKFSYCVDTKDPSASIITSETPKDKFKANSILAAINFIEEEAPWTRKEWVKRFVRSFITYSKSGYIALCDTLAGELDHVAEQLFNAAFKACYPSFTANEKNTVKEALTAGLKSKQTPSGGRSLLVSVVEYMDRSEQSLDISPKLLYDACRLSGHQAKAYYFATKWYYENPKNSEALDALVKQASVLGLHQTALGLATTFSSHSNNSSTNQNFKGQKSLSIYGNYDSPEKTVCESIDEIKTDQAGNDMASTESVDDLEEQERLNSNATINNSKLVEENSIQSKDENQKAKFSKSSDLTTPEWSEQLGNWQAALQGYDSMPKSETQIAGKMRCLMHLMKWNEIIDFLPLIPDIHQLSPNVQADVSSALIRALHNLHRWEEIPPLLPLSSPNDVDSLIIGAIAMYKNAFMKNEPQKETLKQIDLGFDILGTRAQNQFKYDKSALYDTLLAAQELTELKEVILKRHYPNVWQERLKLSKHDLRTSFSILDSRMAYSSFSSQSAERDGVFDEALLTLKAACKSRDWDSYDAIWKQFFPDQEFLFAPEVVLTQAKALWEKGHKQEAFDFLNDFEIDRYTPPKLAASISFYRGQFLLRIPPPNEVYSVVDRALPYLENATKIDQNNYHAWHRYAWASATKYHHDGDTNSAITAINGFIQCVKLKKDQAFSDLVQMVSILFNVKWASRTDLQPAQESIIKMGDESLLKITPQLFAELTTNKENTIGSQFVYDLVKEMLPKHFHALLYPLNELDLENSKQARQLLDQFRLINPDAVDQASIVCQGLQKCASSQNERWLEKIALCNKYFIKREFSKCLEIIQNAFNENQNSISNPSYEICDDDLRFNQKHKALIQQLINCLQRIQSYHSESYLKVVNGTMKELYDKIKSELDKTSFLSIESVAPKLANLKNSILAVPGTYKIGLPLVKIDYFYNNLEMIGSKQRPRYVQIAGSDGITHNSLLKGNEDLRLDQRVMQFFEMINMHMQNDFPPEAKALRLHTYAITPFSTNSGLIQFLDDTDTLYQLISEYRKSHHIAQNIELIEGVKLGLIKSEEKASESIDKMLPIQRLEYLREVSENTSCDDLRFLLLLRRGSTMNWIQRIKRFAESSAVMSIVGYILGLGDRHPSNIMIQRTTADVVHIDFADCFDVGRMRTKFTEKVPFRLTRMMIRAFGPQGIEGEFRMMSMATMKLLRTHRESISAVLNIFLQVPLEGTSSTDGSVELKNNELKKEIELDENDDKPKLNIRSAFARISEKIMGKDNDDGKEHDIDEHVEMLINQATDMYNLAYLYHGWTPLW